MTPEEQVGALTEVLAAHTEGGFMHSVERWVGCLCEAQIPVNFPNGRDPDWIEEAEARSRHAAAELLASPAFRAIVAAERAAAWDEAAEWACHARDEAECDCLTCARESNPYRADRETS